ncbi:MAG: 4Fe-4S binding protein [Candidatus Cryptobacteroides sp.]
MAKRSLILKNWPKYLLQWGVLVAIIAFLCGVFPSTEKADPEALCPMGGLQAFSTFLAKGSLPCSMTSAQIVTGLLLVVAVILFGKLFCAFICPLGTVQDLIGKFRRSIRIKSLPIRNGSFADKFLRIFKYALLFWVFYMTVSASELFCKNFDPYYAVATGMKGEITLWMSVTALVLLILGSFLVDMFWCRYVCPLGAISNTFKFWIWPFALFFIWYALVLLGADIPWWILLAAFCLTGYLLEVVSGKPKMQVLSIIKDHNACNHCGACSRKCPYGIDINSYMNGKVNSVDCTLCGDCVAACQNCALHVGVSRNTGWSGWKKVIAPVLAVGFVAFGFWAGDKVELPTINETWNIETVDSEGNVTSIADSLKLMEIDGLRSVKCYGSSMAFKAKLEKINGVHGVKTYVKSHRATILYNPSVTDPDRIREAVFTPSHFRIFTPDHKEIPILRVYTIRTEKMYDKMDINYLGLQMRMTGKRVYGLETEFACPLIVRVYADPQESLDAEWFKQIVEMKVLSMPVHGGGTKDTPVDYEFVRLEDGYSEIATEDFLRKMFNPFKAEFKSRVEACEGKQKYIYEIEDQNYEKPIILRNMPFLSNHLSKEEGIIGIYLNLNKDLKPAIQIRFSEPMTEEKLWALMTMDTWTITYSKDDVREVPAKLSFKTPGKLLNL